MYLNVLEICLAKTIRTLWLIHIMYNWHASVKITYSEMASVFSVADLPSHRFNIRVSAPRIRLGARSEA